MGAILSTSNSLGWNILNTTPSNGAGGVVKCGDFIIGIKMPPFDIKPGQTPHTYLTRWKFVDYKPTEYLEVAIDNPNGSGPVVAANKLFQALTIQDTPDTTKTQMYQYDPETLNVIKTIDLPNAGIGGLILQSVADHLMYLPLQTPHVQVFDPETLNQLYTFELVQQKPFWIQFLPIGDNFFCIDQSGVAATYALATGQKIDQLDTGLYPNDSGPSAVVVEDKKIFFSVWDYHTRTTFFRTLSTNPLKMVEGSYNLDDSPYTAGLFFIESGFLLGGNNLYSIRINQNSTYCQRLLEGGPKERNCVTPILLDEIHFISSGSTFLRTWEYTAPAAPVASESDLENKIHRMEGKNVLQSNLKTTWKVMQQLERSALSFQYPFTFEQVAVSDKGIYAYDPNTSMLHSVQYDEKTNQFKIGPTNKIEGEFVAMFFCGGTLYISAQSGPSCIIDPVTLLTTPLPMSGIFLLDDNHFVSSGDNGSLVIYDGKTQTQVAEVNIKADRVDPLRVGDNYINLPLASMPYEEALITSYDKAGNQISQVSTGYYGFVDGVAALAVDENHFLVAFPDEVANHTEMEIWSVNPLQKTDKSFVIPDFVISSVGMNATPEGILLTGCGGIRLIGKYPDFANYQVIKATNPKDFTTGIVNAFPVNQALVTVDANAITLWNNPKWGCSIL